MQEILHIAGYDWTLTECTVGPHTGILATAKGLGTQVFAADRAALLVLLENVERNPSALKPV